MAKDVTELWGRKFEIVKNGLSEAQVVSYVSELLAERETLSRRQEHLTSLTKLAEKTVTEAEKLAEEIKREASDKAKADASKIITEAHTRAEQNAQAKRDEIVGTATKQANSIKENAQREAERLKTNAERESMQLKAAAEFEAGRIFNNIKENIRPEVMGLAQKVHKELLSDLEKLNKQVAAMEGEFEQNLAQLIEKTMGTTAAVTASVRTADVRRVSSSEQGTENISDTLDQLRQLIEDGEEQILATSSRPESDTEQTRRTEDSTPVTESENAPVGYSEKVEIEFPSPANLLQILEIDKYLEALPEVAATEIIPIAGKPVITIYLRRPMQLVDTLKTLPEVTQVSEITPEPGTAGSDSNEGKSIRFQVTLVGNAVRNKAKS